MDERQNFNEYCDNQPDFVAVGALVVLAFTNQEMVGGEYLIVDTATDIGKHGNYWVRVVCVL